MNRDLVIVGAGPVGLTLALLAVRQGLRTCVIDAAVAPDPRLRAVTADDESLRIWQACGLERELRDEWAAGRPGAVVCRYEGRAGRPFLELIGEEGDLGYPTAAVIHQPNILRRLWEAAASAPGIRFLRGHRFTSLEQDDRSVRVVCRRPTHPDVALTARWVVACDGSASAVRNALGVRLDAVELPNPWLVADLEHEVRDGQALIRCGVGDTTVTVPLPHGVRRIEVMLGADDDAESWLDDDDVVRARLARAWPGAREARILDRAICRFRAGLAGRWRVGRVLLAGDAAHVTPPFAGQGMAAGLRDAANLSFKIAAACQGWLPESVLETYEAERRPHQERLVALATRLGRIMMPPNRVEASCVQRLLGALSSCPPVRRAISLRGSGLRPNYRCGFLRPGGAAGRYLPQPAVVVPGDRRLRLDALLGPRMTWVVAGGGRPIDLPEASSGDTVLIEGRDFRDPGGSLRRLLGRGGVALVRPDRIIHTHLSPRAARAAARRKSRCPSPVLSPA